MTNHDMFTRVYLDAIAAIAWKSGLPAVDDSQAVDAWARKVTFLACTLANEAVERISGRGEG